MKLFNVLSIAALVFATVACSTGDMMDTESTSINTIATSADNNNAYLSLNINSSNVNTKAVDADEIGQTISSCTVILYNNDGIQSINDNLEVAADGTVNTTLYTKARSDEKVMVIANSTVKFAGNVTTMEDVNNMLQTVSSFSADKLVKVGTEALDFSKTTPSASTVKTSANTLSVSVTVSQLTACIRLAAFNVVAYNGKAADVKVTKVTLNNAKLSEYTNNTEDMNAAVASSSINVNENVAVGGSLSTTPTFFSFANTSSNATSMTIDFTVGGKAYSKTYTINNGAVNSGVLYNLTVNMTINNNNVDVNFTTYTSDWAEGGTINIDMTRNN